MEDYDYSFSQNGLVAYKAGKLIAEQVRMMYMCVCACVLTRACVCVVFRISENVCCPPVFFLLGLACRGLCNWVMMRTGASIGD